MTGTPKRARKIMITRASCKSASLSFLRKQESSLFRAFWTPAFAEVPVLLSFARASQVRCLLTGSGPGRGGVRAAQERAPKDRDQEPDPCYFNAYGGEGEAPRQSSGQSVSRPNGQRIWHLLANAFIVLVPEKYVKAFASRVSPVNSCLYSKLFHESSQFFSQGLQLV